MPGIEYGDLATPALVLGSSLGDDPAPLPDGVSYVALGAEIPDEKWATVLLTVADESALRYAVSALPELGRAKHVACHLSAGTRPLTTILRPEWPPLAGLEADATLTRLTFRRPAPVGPVLVELARSVSPTPSGNRGLVVSGIAVPMDPTVVTDEVPAAVVTAEPRPTEVLGAPPVVVDPGMGPLDEGLLNPIGFRRDWDRGTVPLPDGDPTPAMVAGLRDAQAVEVPPGAPLRTVAGLAMAGVPLVGDGFDAVDLDDPMRREEHSIRIRRAALREYSSLGWRQRVGTATGVRVAGWPSVSVLLPTRRPEQLDFALRQVARQRGVDVELILATHGFHADAGKVRDLLHDRPHTLLPMPADTIFGDVLRAATDAATGDVVVKMDDDDWYGPDVIADLLLARHYSGAELVGMPAELVYLEPIGTTVRRRGPSENYGAVVAGGTMTIDRDLLRAVGGFQSAPRHVDARLLEDVRRAGGSVYRTQGLGYVLRRTSGGHTWDTGLGYFLTRQSLADQWRGFRPSRLLEDA